MKKFFSILLSCAMLINVGIVAMADDGEATQSTNLFAEWGGFENNPTLTTTTVDEVAYATSVGGNITVKSSYVTSDYVRIYGLTTEKAYEGTYSLKVRQAASYAPKIIANGLETGAFYKLSAKFQMAGTNSRKLGFVTYNNASSTKSGVYAVKFDEEEKVSEFKDSYKTYPSGGIYGSETVQPSYWNEIAEYFYIPAGSSATKDVSFGFAIGAKDTFYVDDIRLEKIGTAGTIDGKNIIKKPTSGNSTYQYTLSEDSVFDISDVALVGDYGEAVTFDETTGTLTVTPEATGTITLGITKTVGTETLLTSKEIEIHDCVAASQDNMLLGGDFETEGDLAYALSEQAYSGITYSYNTDTAYCGSASLLVNQPKNYYPLTFKTTLDRGKVYKLTAYALAAEDSASDKVNLRVLRSKSAEGSGAQSIYTYGTDGTQYDAENVYRGSNSTTLSTENWTKFERYIYVSENVTADSINAYIGLASATYNKGISYYIDDVSLVEVGELTGTNCVLIPAEGSVTEPYAFGDGFDIALYAEATGVSVEDDVLTVSSEAVAGSTVSLQVRSGEQVIARKVIMLLDASGVFVEVSDDGSTYKAYVKESVSASGKLLMAKYGTAFEDVATTDSTDKGDYWQISKTSELTSGTYKFMLWDGFDNMKPLANVETVTVD